VKLRYQYCTEEEGPMNADQLKGKWTQFKGELKKKWGEFTDNDLQEIGGNYEKFRSWKQEPRRRNSPTAGRPGLGGLVEGGMPTGRRSREEITRTVDRVEVHVDHKRRYGHEHEHAPTLGPYQQNAVESFQGSG
jgi:uncharacterized protein YjbJ (UPF0337 family)